jgi:hypothetical protein
MAHARTGEAEAKTARFSVYGNVSRNNMPLFLRQQFCGNNTMAAVRKLRLVRYEANNDDTINLSHIYYRLFPEKLLC